MSSPINPLTNYNFAEQGAALAGTNNAGATVVFARDPTTTDTSGGSGSYRVGQQWFSTSSSTLFILTSTSGGSATWVSIGTASNVTVPNGGTGRATLTAHGVLIGEGTSAINQTTAGTNGQVLVGSTGADPVFTTLTSADSSITFTTGAGTLDMVASITADLASPPPIGSVAPNTGAFTTLSSTSTTGLGSASGAVSTIGNTGGAAGIVQRVGTGNFSLDGVAGSTYAVGASTTTGTITIGGTAQTGTMTLGSSSGTNTLIIAGGAGATSVQIANAQIAGSVAVGAAMTTGTIALGGSQTTGTITIGGGVQTGTITVGGGTGAQTVNLATGGTGVKTVHIADSAVANVVTLGSTTGAAALTLNAGSVGISMNGAVTSANAITVTAGNITATNGNLVLTAAGNKMIRSSVGTTTAAGANSIGSVTLVGGTATVATTSVTASSLIKIWRQSVGATGAAALGEISVGTITASTSFVINALQAANATALQASDVSVIGWEIIN